MRVDVVADRELLRRDDALGLEADVEEHLVAVDLDDRAGDDVAVVELDDRGVDRVGERHAAEVVDDELVLGLVLVLVVVRVGVGLGGVGASPSAPRRRWRSVGGFRVGRRWSDTSLSSGYGRRSVASVAS